MLLSPGVLSAKPIGRVGFPGQPGNQVGFAAAPAFPGLTTFSGTLTSGSSGSHQVYMFQDFNPGGTGTTLVNDLSYVDFIGCRFQSNATGDSNAGANVSLSGSDHITFTFCSFVPLTSFYTTPPGAAWPSAGAYPNVPSPLGFTTDTNCINGLEGFQYGCNVNDTGPVTWTSCDFWGHGQNGPGFFTTTEQMIVDNCWIHDCCNQAPEGYHSDGVGYQNSGVGPNNVTISNCTIASLGNSNGIAWQGATGGYDNIVMTGNYLSGFAFQTILSTDDNMTNTTFSNNTFGTDVQWIFGPLYHDYTSMFSGNGNTWSGNTFHVVPGSAPYPGGTAYGFTGQTESNPEFTSGDDGKFIWPDTSLNVSDF